jgi:hypothetical protein
VSDQGAGNGAQSQRDSSIAGDGRRVTFRFFPLDSHCFRFFPLSCFARGNRPARGLRSQKATQPMKAKIIALLKSPMTYVLLAIGGILVLAVPALAKWLKPAADLVPGSKSKTTV